MRKRIQTILAVVTIIAGIYLYKTSSIFQSYRVNDNVNLDFVHFSIDDCNDMFKDLTDNEDKYNSLFEQETLGYLKKLHDDYGTVFSLYVFYVWDITIEDFDLSMTTDKFKREFQDNSDWLKIGFHAADANAWKNMTSEEILEYYIMTIEEIIRFAGEESIDTFLRLDRFIADNKTIECLMNSEYPITGLFIADRKDKETRKSYSLSDEELKLCYQEDWYVDSKGLCYTPTDIRLEDIQTNDEFYDSLNNIGNQRNLVIFTHEFEMDNKKVLKYMKLFSEGANKRELNLAYPFNE